MHVFTFVYHYYILGACPNNCYGHGTCTSLKDASLLFGPDYDNSLDFLGDGIGAQYLNWDAESISMCECDANFFGPDCSLSKFLCSLFWIYIYIYYIYPFDCAFLSL